MSGKLFIIPIPISNTDFNKVITPYTVDIAKSLRLFVVEKIKTSRQFLRQIDSKFPIDESTFFELNKHKNYEFNTEVIELLKSGKDVGIMSEAGYPGIADPGSAVVKLAHQNNIEVIPLIGPSSLFLALAASGLNGQGFTFNGYLPKDERQRMESIKRLSVTISNTGFAQLFIETPYRNQAIFTSLLKHASPDLELTIAIDITGEKEKIKTLKIKNWPKAKLIFEKAPCVFILGQFS